eukprot:6213456-Pleurochrysis_carterae.AAC.2
MKCLSSVAHEVAQSNNVGRAPPDRVDVFDCLYRRLLGVNEISGTIPDVAALTNLVQLYAAMPLDMACTCVA